ncbi:MAG TPA: class I tRNA ligase family protein [Candidatus Absconditabacterales bacterium]|nr:class I tRNA ligase family protein [Candidatus Absconditabacterales bacterium]
MDFVEIGKKRQKKRSEEGVYKVAEDQEKEKFYILDMFPYPSGAGLHVGHPKGYIATDVIARKHMLMGKKVLHPMGFDTFGLGTEQYAIKNKMKPQIAAAQNIETYKKQMEMFGCTYDRDREVNTADPKYFKRTQQVFLKLYDHYYDEKTKKADSVENLEIKIENGDVKVPDGISKEEFLDSQRLAYMDYKPINRCPKCMTGLANEDLSSDGTCERCGTMVEQRLMRQRVIRITKYAERLLEGLDQLPEWTDSAREQQKNWIGKSEGTQFEMKLDGFDDSFEVYTTRVDTVFGMSFVVMAPEHDLVDKITTPENKQKVEEYKEAAKHKTQLERTELQKDKSGVFTGAYAINPFNEKKIPVYVGDYVLANYGTGVVMAVPAHDERDFEFARKYNIKITTSIIGTKVNDTVVSENPCLYTCNEDTIYNKADNSFFRQNIGPELGLDDEKNTFCIKHNRGFVEDLLKIEYDGDIKILIEKGTLVDSGEFTGLESDDAIEKMQGWLQKEGIGGKKINYRLQDRVFSRQRYWGEPIPMVHCDKCGVVPLEEKDLPLELPDVENYEPTGTEEGPLATIDERINVKCSKCGGMAKRESNTMPGWAGSSWYWIRYMDPDNQNELVSPEKERFWHPVDVYVGGAEHITRHMIYARFWHKFLQDLGIVSVGEPFKRYQHVGLIMAEDGRKMSKRRGNVINPDDIINEFGSDTLRVYEMFMGPFDQAVAWNTNGVKGVKKFLDKVVNLYDKIDLNIQDDKKVLNALHQTIKKVTEDIDRFGFNTAISQMMILVNKLSAVEKISKDTFEKLILILAPFAPHLAEEFWEKIGGEFSLFNQDLWPKYDEKYLVQDTIKMAIQFNGKVRGTIDVAPNEDETKVLELVQSDDKMQKYMQGDIIKVIYIPGKICNIVVKS